MIKPRAYDLIFLFHLILSFMIRLPYVFAKGLGSDDALYCWYAQRLYAKPSILFSKEIIEYHPPLFSLILSIGNAFSDPLVAYHFIMLAFSLLGVVAIYILGTLLSSRFAGLVCAILLSFNYPYLLNGNSILIDIPLSAMSTIFLITLVKTHESNRWSWFIGAGVAASAMILLKWSGIIVIPFLIIYCFFRPERTMFKTKKAFVPLAITISLTLILMILNQWQLGSLLPNISALGSIRQSLGSPLQQDAPPWYYIVNLHNILVFPHILPIFLYGLIICLATKLKHRRLLLTYFLVALISISFIYIKALRYSLLILPVMLIICGLGLEELIRRVCKNSKKIWIGQIIGLCFCYLLCWHYYPKMENFFKVNSSLGTGFQEAGQWIKQNTNSDTMIITQSLRPIRYFSGINDYQFGGQLYLLPRQKKEFEALVRKTKGHAILQVDFWSDFNVSDFFSFTDTEKETQYFKSLGFTLSKEIARWTYSKRNRNKENTPVIRLYEKR